MKLRCRTPRFTRFPMFPLIALATLLSVLGLTAVPSQAVTLANIIGEIERITLNDPNDAWSGGTIVVGGQVVIIPRNLLIDLPANRLTLKQLFDLAPAVCVANGETGLAKADSDECNTSDTGAFATMSANRSDEGNVIAGDVLIDKGLESVTGTVTFINYDEGYYRLDGQPGADFAGVIVRLNDPGAKHTVQEGLGCLVGSENCSPDPRFTLDPDNYTNVFSNGYPYCLPSTVTRTFPGLPAISGVPALDAGPTQADASGNGDLLCPQANRPADLGTSAADSRRFAPLKINDTVTAEGNFETIGGVRFLSAHSSTIGVALQSAAAEGHPDYFFLAEVFMDAPAFFNQRYRALIIGYTTLADPAAGGTDVLFWTIHRDKVSNAIHELPWATVQGCDGASGAGTCSSQGLTGAGGNIFRIRHDVDFLLAAADPQGFGSADPKLSPCAHLRNEARFDNTAPFCPSATAAGSPGDETGSLAEEFGIFSPIPHEIMARTGRKVADTLNAIGSIDVSGNTATWGEYLFPFGVNLGGISLQEMNEIDLNLMGTPSVFEGIPWNLDRRLGPGGCGDGPCEADDPTNPYKYALDPFPYSGFHPKTALVTLGIAPPGGLPTGTYNDPNFTASQLSDVQDRMFSFVDSAPGAIFNGDSTVIPNTSFASLIPPAFPIDETPSLPGSGVPPDNVTLTPSSDSPQTTGTQVTFTAAASGGSGPYEYEFWFFNGSTYDLVQPYSTLATYFWNTNGVAPNSYLFAVRARNLGSSEVLEATKEVGYTITAPAAADNVTLTPSSDSPQPTGTQVTFTAAASGGSGIYEYEFWFNNGSSYDVVQPYSTLATYFWNTNGVAPNSYLFAVRARNLGSSEVLQATKEVGYTITAPPAADNVTLTPSSDSPQPTGTQVTFTALATPGGGTYEYEFWFFNGISYDVVQPYSTLATYFWNTNGVDPGSYLFAVRARNLGSSEVLQATKEVEYILTPIIP